MVRFVRGMLLCRRGRWSRLWSCVMLVKSLAISVAAALLGPTIGMGVYVLANSDGFGDETIAFSSSTRGPAPVPEPSQADIVRMSAPPGSWLNPVSIDKPVRKPETAAATQPLTELSPWRTVVRCPEGQLLPEDDRCPSPKNVMVLLTEKHPLADLTPAAGNLGFDEIVIPELATAASLQGRMSLGGP